MARPASRLLFAIWLCFVLRLIFYAAVYPIWEGLDEWGHMAYVDHLRQTGSPPVREAPVSGEISASLRLGPIPHHLPVYLGGGTSRKEYWNLPESERSQREGAYKQLRVNDPPQPGLRADNYQAQHPPVAYYLLYWLDVVSGLQTLPERLYMFRLVLVVIASLCLPLLWMLARRVFANPDLALPACLMLAVIPNFAIYVARVGNDPLAIVLLALCLVVIAGSVPFRHGIANAALAGALAGLTAITKAYGILLMPVYALAAVAAGSLSSGWLRQLRHIAVASTAFFAVAGWWFLDNIRTTGALSGERLDADATAIPLAQRLPNLLLIDWWEIWMYGTSSYYWIGGWSFLLLPDWLYWIFRIVSIVVVVGLLRAALRMFRARSMLSPLTLPAFWAVPLPLVALFIVSIVYQGWQIFSAHGQSTAIGWYLCSATNAVIVVMVAGLGYAFGPRHATRIATSMVLVFAVLDLFTVNLVSLPYYAGITPLPRGHFPVMQLSQWPAGGFGEMAQRLSINHPEWLSPGVLLALWVLYLLATLTVVTLACWYIHSAKRQTQPSSR
ncbi:MAG: glycosyltransferase family 39 protein [Bryobacterales bacterium]|nr:glycosyltransferase family 39 protein [Bryobacterales bacterium]